MPQIYNSDAFARIASGNVPVQIMGGLPNCSFPVGGWDMKTQSAWSDECPSETFPGSQVFPPIELPEVQPLPPFGELSFPISHNPKALDAISLFADGLLSLGKVAEFDDGALLICSLLELFFVNEGQAQEWSPADAPYPHMAGISQTQLRLTYWHWQSVHIMAELGGWYNHSLVDIPDDQWTLLLRFEPQSTSELILGVRTSCFNWELNKGSIFPAYNLQAHLFYPLESLVVALELNEYFDVGGAGFFSILEVVGNTLEWFHGPSNAYETCRINECVKIAPEQWCGSVSNTLAAPVAPYLQCAWDGKQAWSHPVVGAGCMQSTKYTFYVNGAPLNNPLWAAKIKLGGCSDVAGFAIAVLAAMNIPAVYCCAGIPVLFGPTLSDVQIGQHGGIYFPFLKMGVFHGDDLWGPGASLFQPMSLLVPAEKLFAGVVAHGQFNEPWLTKGGNNVGAGVSFSELKGYAASPAQLECFATQAYVTMLAYYWTCRRYFKAMLQSAHDPRRSSIIRDAGVFHPDAPEDNVLAFRAVKYWAEWCLNPAHQGMAEELKGYVVKELVPPELVNGHAVSVWHDHEIQSAVLSAYEKLELKWAGYDLVGM
jgi:hypothetical protein